MHTGSSIFVAKLVSNLTVCHLKAGFQRLRGLGGFEIQMRLAGLEMFMTRSLNVTPKTT